MVKRPVASTASSSSQPSKLDGEKGKKPRRTLGKSAGRDICFVLMPFGGWQDDYYELIYKPAIDSSGLEARRADDLFRPSTIVHDIWAYTKKAKLLLADLSGRNPNVFYELGLAHALGKPAILVAESMEEVPFDLRALRVILYDKNAPEWGSVLKQKITNSIGEVLESPIAAVLPAFLEGGAVQHKPVVSQRDLELVEMKQQIELLRHELRATIDRPSTRVLSRGRDIGPVEAERRIREYLELGMQDADIVRILRPLGPPRAWIWNKIQESRIENRRRKRSANKPA